MKVSQIDIDYLKIIRQSVELHIKDASAYDREGLMVLDIAPQDHKGAKEYFKKAMVATLDIAYGWDYCADICQDNSGIIPRDFFDIIICTEVLEHVANPFGAAREMKRILKPGGLLFLTTPFNFRIHGPLPDRWRFTKYGLREIFKDWDMIIEEVESDRFLMPVHYRVICVK